MRFIIRCLLLLSMFGMFSVRGYSQSRLWERHIAVTYGAALQGRVTSDGGAVVTVVESDQSTIGAVRSNADGVVLWHRDFPVGYYVTVDAAGPNFTYVMQSGVPAMKISLLDASGADIWQRTVSIAGDSALAFISSVTRPDGSLLIATVQGIVAYSIKGEKQFEVPPFDVSYNDFTLQPAPDTGFFVFSQDTIYRYDPRGTLLWQRVPPRHPDDASGIIGAAYATRDTGLMIATGDYSGHELILSKLASDGSLSWRKTVGPAGYSNLSPGSAVVKFCEGPKNTIEVLFEGSTTAPNALQHLYTLRLSSSGETQEMHAIATATQSVGWSLQDFMPASDSDSSAVWVTVDNRSTASSTTSSTSLARLGNVPVNDRRWVYSIDGESVFTFDAASRWSGTAYRKHDQPLRRQISVRNDTVWINKYLTFVGDITIDSSDYVNLSGHGRFFVPSFIVRIGALNVSDTLRNISLYNGDFSFGLGSGTITQFVNAVLPDKFFGCSITIDSLRVLGGLDAYGVGVAGHFSLPNAIPFTDSTSRISIDDLVLTKDSIHWRGHISDLQLTKDWKLKAISGSYDYYNDSLALSCAMTLPMFKDVIAKASIKQGRLAYAATSVDATNPIPLGIAGFTVTKLSAQVGGLAAPPLKVLMNASLGTTPENLMMLDLEGNYVGGHRIGFYGNMKLYFVAGSWQAAARVSGRVYFNSNVELNGGVDLVTLGTGYLISGQAALKYVKRPNEQLSGSIAATLTLPKLPGERDNAAIRWFNDIAGLPFTFAHANVLLKDTSCHVALGADLGIANVTIAIDPRKPWGDTNLIRVNARFKELPHSGTMQKGHAQPQAITQDSTQVSEPLDKLIVEIAPSSGTVPATRLTDPSGSSYSATSGTTVIYSEASDKHNAFWTIPNPQPGTWKIAADADLPAGAIVFYGTAVDSDFTIDVAQSGNTLTITPTGSSWTSRTDYYVDTNGTGYDGILIGSMHGSAPLVVVLPNSLPACVYHVYGVREANGGPDDQSIAIAYAPQIVALEKPELVAPMNVAASISTSGHVRVQWQNATTTSGITYAVHLIGATGFDSIYAMVDASATSVEFDATPAQTYSVSVQPYDADGIAGCGSVASDVVLGVKSTALAVTDAPPTVYPNPAIDRVVLLFSVDSRSAEEVWLVDPLGQIRMAVPMRIYEPGSYEIPLDLHGMPAGTYFARLSGDRTMTVAISKK